MTNPSNPFYTKGMNNTDTTFMTDEAIADFFARSLDRQVYATEIKPQRRKLANVTWCLGDEPTAQMKHDLLWCDKRKGR